MDLKEEVGLEINVRKTKAMIIKTDKTGQNVTAGNNSMYLGSKVNNTNAVTQEMRHRLVKGNQALPAYHNVMKFQLVWCKTKLTIHKMIIRPIVSCRCETWAVT